jgi:hypothetical protein
VQMPDECAVHPKNDTCRGYWGTQGNRGEDFAPLVSVAHDMSG